MLMLCENCSSEMTYFQKGMSCGWECPNCSRNIVTTYISPIYADKNTYTIRLCPGQTPSVDSLKVISEIINENYLSAKKLMESAPAAVFGGRASEVCRIKEQLEKADIKFFIEPDFPY